MTAQFLAVTTFTQLTNHSSTAPISLSQTHKRSAQPIDLPPTQESSVTPTNLSPSYDWLIGDTHLPFAYHSLLQKLASLTSLARKKASQIWLVKKKWLIFCMTHRTGDSSHKWLIYVFSTTYLSKLTGEVPSDRLDENRKNELECLFHLLLYFIKDNNRYYSKSSNR